MSEERKSIGAGKIGQVPDKRIRLKIGNGVVQAENLAENSVTPEKISPDFIGYVTEDVQNQIDSIQIGGWAISNEFGNDPHIGISQKTLTLAFNNTVSHDEKGAASGVATLDSYGKVPQSQLPSYVDDVVEGYFYNNAFYSDAGHTELITAESGKIYVDIPSKISYRYSGTAYVVIGNPYYPDEEDLTVSNDAIKLKDKAYNTSVFSGLGKKILRKNIVNNINVLTQAMINASNTVYIIQYDFDLNGESIEMPDNCVLQFDGGSLCDGTLVGDMTQIVAGNVAIFNDITISGDWNVPQITSAWFKDATQNNVVKQCFNLANDDIHNIITIEDGTYPVATLTNQTGAITIGSNTEINLIGKIKQLPNSFNAGYVIDLSGGAENVYIHGSGTIEGDKQEHTGSGGEHGHGINICNASNVIVEGVAIKYCWGDCVYIGYQATPAVNVVLRNLTMIEGRRQGVSITSCKNVIIENCTIRDINGTAPQSGIDIEPNTNSVVDNIVIRNCSIIDCSGWGIELYNKNISSINDVLIQNVVIDGCAKGIGSTKINITGLTIDSVIIKNHTSKGLYIYPYEDNESEVDLSNIRNVNLTNVYVDNQDNSITAANVYVWTHNGSIQGCTFKDACILRSYNYTDENHPEHGLNITSTFLIAEGKTVNLHTGCVLSQVSINCGLLRLPNGHTQFTGCDINCTGISSSTDGTSASSYNTFTACSVYSTGAIRFNIFCSITQSIISCTSNIHLGKYSVVTGNKITAKIRCNDAQAVVSNNQIVLSTSVIGTDNYVVRMDGDHCNVSNNDITVSDDNTSITSINGVISSGGTGGVVRNNRITLSGERNYCKYGIYVSSTNNAIIVENNSFTLTGTAFSVNYYNVGTDNPIPYADISKNRIGATENRPTLLACNKTFQYFDTTLGYPIWWTGTAWVDSSGTSV